LAIVHTSRPDLELTPEAAGARRRVLLVDDDPDAALFFTHVLSRQGGFDVTHRLDPHAALDLARRERWDLVITDLDLPGMTGLDLLAALRSADRAFPVLLVTARYPLLLPPSMAAPDAMLAKPVPAARLLATAEALAGRYQVGQRA
jgi:DNA-binding response OmpR family regulator